jgi:glutamine synthetase
LSPPGPPAGVDRVRIELPDTNGHLRGKWLPPAKLAGGKPLGFSDVIYCLTCAEEVFENPGFSSEDTGWPDILAVPDEATAAPVPTEPGTLGVLCDATTVDGAPLALDQRAAVRRAEARLATLGLSARCGVEYEIFLFHGGEEAEAALRDGRPGDLVPVGVERQAYSLLRGPELAGLLDSFFASLEPYGVPIDSVLTELGYGMIEVGIGPLEPLAAADAAARFKLATKEIAAAEGMIATFVPKLDAQQSGSSGHVHLSLVRDGENALWAGPRALSELGVAALGGLCRRAAETSVFMAPNVNSYRRFRPETWTPTTVGWGHDNRNAAIRAITVEEGATRFELRRAGADLNPYLSIAAGLNACAEGIEEGLAPPPPAPGRAWEADAAPEFPADLAAATDLLESSDFAREALGSDLVDHYVISRRAEGARCAEELGSQPNMGDEQVPDAEVRRYLNVV